MHTACPWGRMIENPFSRYHRFTIEALSSMKSTDLGFEVPISSCPMRPIRQLRRVFRCSASSGIAPVYRFWTLIDGTFLNHDTDLGLRCLSV